MSKLDGFGDAPALIAGDQTLSYRKLAEQADAFGRSLGSERCLLLLEGCNAVPAVIAYLGALRAGHAVLLVAPDKPAETQQIVESYRPKHAYRAHDGGFRLETFADPAPLHEELALLLSTSGTTGSRKFVRLSHENLQSNAESIASYLELRNRDVAITALPISYSYGLSVLNSHLACGAAIVVTERSVTDREFWQQARTHGVTSLAGVPHSFDLLERVGFFEMDLPSLRTLTQAGGRLAPDKVERFARHAQAHGRRFFVMYGQTEATARMAYLPPERALAHPDCIGLPIPGGAFELRDEHGARVETVGAAGELIYRGPNVMLGYALGADDLCKGRELHELVTGDLACRTISGLYKIVGRKSRFTKLFGLRVNLDEVEADLRAQGHQVVCSGNDEQLIVATRDAEQSAAIEHAITARYALPRTAVAILAVAEFPLLPSGKYDYAKLRDLVLPRPASVRPGALRSLRAIFREHLGVEQVQGSDTFTTLGGDSLAYVQASHDVEQYLGHLPRDWAELTLDQLEALPRRRGGIASVEIGAAMRALGIVTVVNNHVHLIRWWPAAGALLLLLLAGHGFARFQLTRILREDSPWPAVRGLQRVILPTMALVLLRQSVRGDYFPSPLLLVNNLVDPNLDLGGSFWFVELLVQTFVVMALIFALPPVRRVFRSAPYASSVGMLLVFAATNLLGPSAWDTHALYNRVPHMMGWLFVLGMVTSLGSEGRKRWLSTALLLSLGPLLMETTHFRLHGLLICGLGLSWIPHVAAPAPVARGITLLAAASLHIYLTHSMTIGVLRKLIGDGQKGLEVLVGLAGGIALFLAIEWVLVRIARMRGRAFEVQATERVSVY